MFCNLFCFSRYQKSFHGVNLTTLHEEAMQEYFRQPIVDTFDIRICMSKSVKHSVDFAAASETDLHLIGTEANSLIPAGQTIQNILIFSPPQIFH